MFLHDWKCDGEATPGNEMPDEDLFPELEEYLNRKRRHGDIM